MKRVADMSNYLTLALGQTPLPGSSGPVLSRDENAPLGVSDGIVSLTAFDVNLALARGSGFVMGGAAAPGFDLAPTAVPAGCTVSGCYAPPGAFCRSTERSP